MGLNLDEGSLIQVHVAQNDLGAFLETQVLHHPVGDVADALLR